VNAAEIARLLGLPAPTAEQTEIIEAPLEPAIVVAGAGSGKTETMAARVVWLIANEFVAPEQILGLTFTRKAAGELAERIRLRIAMLRGHLATSGVAVAAAEVDPLSAPTVSTYNSFANTIFRENALSIGREADGTVLTEASAWQLARSVVVAADDGRLVELGKRVDAVTSAVLSLSRALNDNVRSTDDVRTVVDEFTGIIELPWGSSRVKDHYKSVRDAVAAVGSLPVLLDLVDRYDDAKRRRGFIEFSDQVALALTAVERVPGLAADYRSRFRVVLLDEYQDTSVVQTRLLAGLFGRHPVMAVGDPHQSIYGWRGASATNFGRFAYDFTGARDGAARYDLSISWRNPSTVLDAANTIVLPLSASSPVPVKTLTPGPAAGAGSVELAFEQTVLDEADRVAGWLQAQLAVPTEKGEPRTAALLCRSIKRIDAFTAALRRRGVKYHVLGVGGLLLEPPIVDLVCALRVLHDPEAGSELIRLLAGARWRVGVRDIKALRDLASELVRRDYRLRPLEPEVREALYGSVAAEDGASIIDALDFIVAADPERGMLLRDFTAEGLARLKQAGVVFERLRGRTGLELHDLVTLVIQELRLDIEVEANESAARGRNSLHAFLELVAGYLSLGDENARLGSFLGWLAEAERRENLSPRSDPPEPGTVQILTIHGSKGLEWDIVAVPRLVAGELPAPPQDSSGWLGFGQLPNELRGDADVLPLLDWRGVATQKEFDDAVKDFKQQIVRRNDDEQRRLVYVAYTRTRSALLLSGSYWSTQKKPREAGAFLTELVAAGLLPADAIPDFAVVDENPIADIEVESILWPTDPLGERGPAVRRAAHDVRQAPELTRANRWWRDTGLLLAERAERSAGRAELAPPTRVPASRFKDYISDPAGTLEGLRRPLPERPYRATRLGTIFHSWVESRSLGLAGDELDAADFDEGEPLERLDAERLAEFRATFERSAWAGLKPVEVEIEIHAPLAGHVFVCKLDAVYRLADGSYQIVDWKTGKAPKDADDLERKQFQLALYRHAYASWKGVPPETIDAVLYFVADDEVIRPERIYSSSELESRWRSTFSPSSSTGASPAE
jgi:DNA helicase-2/ATP-dependent DNA helicase PcrA